MKRKLEKLKVEQAKLKEQKEVMQAARSELEQEWLERLTELDQDRYQAACACVQASTEQIKVLVRLELAKKLGDGIILSRFKRKQETAYER